MLKKALLLVLALLFAVGAHLRPCREYLFPGGVPPLVCSLRTADLSELAARAAAEEISRGPALTGAVEKRLRLRFRRPSADVRTLTDALLKSYAGVVLCDEVRVDGERLGWVSDGGALREALARYIGNTLPSWADGGVLSRELKIRPLYTREHTLTKPRDMLLLITGAAPVYYYNAEGRFARA